MCTTDQNALTPSSFSIDFVACSTPWYLEMGLPWRRVVEAIRLDSCHPTVGGDLVISVMWLTYPSDQHIGQAVLHGSYGLTNCIDINICIFYSWHGNLAWNHITARRLKVKVNAEIFPVSHLASFPCLFHLQFLIAWFSLCFCILQAIKNWRRGRPGNEATTLCSLLYRKHYIYKITLLPH